MLTVGTDICIIGSIMAAAGFFLFCLRRFGWLGLSREHNDLSGWQMSLLGTTYAVVSGFMLYAVWSTFQTAEVNAELEAASLINVFRLATGLPDPQAQQMRTDCIEYARVMIEDEWPAMSRMLLSPSGEKVAQELWITLKQTQAHSDLERGAIDRTFTELTTLTEHRRVRLLQSRSKLPDVLWWVLVSGAFLTVSSTCLFGATNFKLHLLQVLGFSFLIAFMLVAIGEIDQPFQGSVHVNNMGFRLAQERMHAIVAEGR